MRADLLARLAADSEVPSGVAVRVDAAEMAALLKERRLALEALGRLMTHMETKLRSMNEALRCPDPECGVEDGGHSVFCESEALQFLCDDADRVLALARSE